MISPTPSIVSSSSLVRVSTRSHLFSQKRAIRRAFAVPMFGIPRLYKKRAKSVFLAFSTEFLRLRKDFSPKPSIFTISCLYSSTWKRSESSLINPRAMSFSIVISESPSIFIASLETKCVKFLICFARHAGFGHTRVSTPFSAFICVYAPHTGQFFGILTLFDLVRFSAICGIIMFALYTVIVSPIPSASSRMTLML